MSYMIAVVIRSRCIRFKPVMPVAYLLNLYKLIIVFRGLRLPWEILIAPKIYSRLSAVLVYIGLSGSLDVPGLRSASEFK